MFKGALIMESLRVGTSLTDLNLKVREIYRFDREDAASGQPRVWSVVELEIRDEDAADIARMFADALTSPGWYVDLRSDTEAFVVFPGRVFQYLRSDDAGRAEARSYARSAGIPENQIDWPA